MNTISSIFGSVDVLVAKRPYLQESIAESEVGEFATFLETGGGDEELAALFREIDAVVNPAPLSSEAVWTRYR